jgi:hypothetical protein
MELTFDDADLAGTCNRRQRMVRHWGDEGFRSIALRLSQLAAVADTAELEALPGTQLIRSRGGTVKIEFDAGQLVIRGTLSGRNSSPKREHLGLLISRIDLNQATVAP